MKLRYILRGEYYFPQYLTKKNVWVDLEKGNVPESGDFHKIITCIGDIQLPRRFGERGQWHFNDEKIFFTKKNIRDGFFRCL